MIHSNFPLVVLEGASVLGTISFLGLRFRQPKSITALMARVDTRLMRELYMIQEDRNRTHIDGRVVWSAIGGIRGVPHFLYQGSLLVRIICEIQKQHPGEYNFQAERVCGVRGGLVCSILGSLWDALRAHSHPCMARVSTFVAGNIFVNLAAECESVMEDAGYSFPGILMHP